MFCTACGNRNADISNFCKQCGHKLDRAAAPRISEEAFDRALPLEEQVSALLERAYRLRKSGELSSAVRLCEEALLLNPESTSVHSLLGQIQEQIGNHDAAIHEYERVLQLNPGSIADRVKLDELRGDGLPIPVHPRSAPHIVMPNRSLPNTNSRQLLGIAGIAGVLMVMGGLLALKFFTHPDKNDSQAIGGSSRNGNRIASNSPQADPATGSGGASTGANTNTGGSAPANANTGAPNSGTPSGLPTNATYTGMASYPPQNVYVTPRTVYVHDGPSAGVNSRNAGGLPNLANARSQATDDGDRLHLDGNEKPYNIVIRPTGDGADSTASDNTGNSAPPKGANPAPPKGTAASKGNPPVASPVIPGKLTVHPPTDNGNSNAGGGIAAPSTEAQSLIVIASDKYKTNDYDGAIKAYRRALPGAGNQTGYVYQQMGICFQRIKNKASAIDNFNNAIAEYKRLENANQQVDLARVGIRVCENGIKLCNAE
ncbi:MAG: Tetratricopeptide repeat [Chthonomonadaceae bacterium]|nr:Tetratricopeptide repeat [Chthonomonadaceae bacterium]